MHISIVTIIICLISIIISTIVAAIVDKATNSLLSALLVLIAIIAIITVPAVIYERNLSYTDIISDTKPIASYDISTVYDHQGNKKEILTYVDAIDQSINNVNVSDVELDPKLSQPVVNTITREYSNKLYNYTRTVVTLPNMKMHYESQHNE